MYHHTFNKSALHYDETFCVICSGPLSYPAHECPTCSAKAIQPYAACMKEGTKCIYAGLSTECITCHKGLFCFCTGGIPDRQIVLMPFNNLHPEEDEHFLSLIEDMIDCAPFGVKTPDDVSLDHHTEDIINNTKAYIGINAQQFSFTGIESISTLVKAKNAYHNHLKTNTSPICHCQT
ncbi:hypothetical protein IW262DRAFT_1467484 [Armillaria fumosa]|nr:hypothetical protein IW262DRAFT_1467484 [Armillaria fumosa]